MVAYKKTCRQKNEPSVLYENNNSSSPVATVLIIKVTAKKDILQRSEYDNLSLNTDLSRTVDKNIFIDFEKVEFEVQLS